MKTQHMLSRMRQRNICEQALNMIQTHGKRNHRRDRIILDRRAITVLLEQSHAELRALQHAHPSPKQAPNVPAAAQKI